MELLESEGLPQGSPGNLKPWLPVARLAPPLSTELHSAWNWHRLVCILRGTGTALSARAALQLCCAAIPARNAHKLFETSRILRNPRLWSGQEVREEPAHSAQSSKDATHPLPQWVVQE